MHIRLKFEFFVHYMKNIQVIFAVHIKYLYWNLSSCLARAFLNANITQVNYNSNIIQMETPMIVYVLHSICLNMFVKSIDTIVKYNVSDVFQIFKYHCVHCMYVYVGISDKLI